MSKLFGVLMVLGLAASPAFAQKITIDYDHDFDFEKIKTFQYVETKESDAKNNLMAGRIHDAIISELEQGGLRQVESEPDLFVTYHMTTKDQTEYYTSSFGYGGYGGGWGRYGGGMGTASSTTTATTFTEGTLILDAYGPDDKKMVWRGIGTVTIKSKPESRSNRLTVS